MPEVDLGYLIAHLWEVGPTMPGGMGDSPLTHGELRDWQDNVGIELQPWEVRILHRLSFAYLAQKQISDKPDCPPPYAPPFGFFNRAAVARKVDELFG